MTALCDACGAPMSEEVERMTARLIALLDEGRAQRLADLYQGTAPTVLDAGCFNETISTVNAAAAVA